MYFENMYIFLDLITRCEKCNLGPPVEIVPTALLTIPLSYRVQLTSGKASHLFHL
jgi:hypothetical protein